MISTDPRVTHLLDIGYVVVSESWGAHVAAVDAGLTDRLRAHLSRIEGQGLVVAAVPSDSDVEIERLDQATRDDYPATAATPHTAVDVAEVRRLRDRGFEFFGAFDDDRVAAVTAIAVVDGRAETQFTAVDRAHRRRGLATAVKSASMLDAISRGATSFATGGAATNAASRKMNENCGYVIDELWMTLERPS